MSVLAPWLVFLAVLAYGMIHSWLASLRFKAWLRSWVGPGMDRWYRLAYNLFATLSLLPVLALPLALPDRSLYAISFPWSLFTLVLQGLAALVLAWGLLQTGLGAFLGLTQLFGLASTGPDQLVTGGLYHWVRHPLYTAGLMFIWLVPVMTWNLLALNLGLTIYLVAGAMLEERKLIRKFGAVYLQYRRRTPMLIPGFKRRS